MNIELEEKLNNRFPFTKNPYCGNSCPNGWFNLVWNLCLTLEVYKFSGKVNQIKEKFGGLRFYVSHATDKQYDIIHKAEEKSYKICEVCGKKGKLRKLAWAKTLCWRHYYIEDFFGIIARYKWRLKKWKKNLKNILLQK